MGHAAMASGNKFGKALSRCVIVIVIDWISDTVSERGWTKTHGHFLVMGGFMLYRNGVPVQTLSIEKFHRHLEAGSIDFPNITEEDILDRSKSDFLQRTIVIVQVVWFALQCIARRALGLTITELEVVTLAFTTLNGAMFAFWWNKPLDVRRPFRIDFKPVPVSAPPEPPIEITTVAKAESDSPPTLEPAAPVNRYARIADEEDWLYMTLLRKSEAKRMQSYSDSGGIPLRSRLRDQASKMVSSSSNVVVQFFKSIVDYVQKEGLVSAVFHVFVVWPIERVLNGLGDIVESDDSKKVRKGALRVPTFYAPMMVPDAVAWVRAGAAALGVVFGSIHMAAWSGTFPSHGEQTTWRVASVIITVLPGVILLANVVNFWLERDEDRCCGCFEDCVAYIEYVVGAGGILVSRIFMSDVSCAVIHGEISAGGHWTRIFVVL
ncbi:hypothetical protein JR316_0004082 [Psilocybe cubensis]|uniref:Uncharacterized protein n=1 Tax=Psilocybe cubensis TaxID=181762 RepID=A0ACB8H9A7_PSICU|nr:hypothetical protein JR316_0004082 [Psilocybe cubensis]KAH9484600.1 hypothetical protein JR316_0004082 [Psilocybe cubensis]